MTEPDEWTKQDDETWRKGRWVVFKASGVWCVTHEDFQDVVWMVPFAPTSAADRVAGEVAEDFLAHPKATERTEAWRDAKPGDVLDVRIDGGEWVRCYVVKGLVNEKWLALFDLWSPGFCPWEKEEDAARITDSRRCAVTVEGGGNED